MDEPASILLMLFANGEIAQTIASETWLSILLKLLSVLLLIAANGFFVAAEFAFVGVRKSRIELLANDGNKGAKRLLKLLENLNAYLSATQLGITLASLGLGWLGEPLISALLAGVLTNLSESAQHIISFVVAFSVITSLHIILGEQAPKLLGLELAERVALAVTLPMQLFYNTFKLPIHALDWASAKTVRIFGLHSNSEHASIYTEDELRQLIDISRKSGHVNHEEHRLINQVFEFSETTVREAMIPRTEIASVSSDCSLHQIAKAFESNTFSRMPVYRGSLDDVIGFVHSKDIMSYLLHPEDFRLEKILQTPIFIVDSARLEDVLRQMQRAKAHFGFVVDEHGGVEGIITLEDLLEEIVGDISDEHDEEVNEQIAREKDGTYLLDGGLTVRDLNKRLDLHVPESDAYTTIAGFLMSEAGQVLTVGETVRFNGYLFRIEKVDKRRILQVKLENAEEIETATV